MTRPSLSIVRHAVDDAGVIDDFAGTNQATVGRTTRKVAIALVHIGPLTTKQEAAMEFLNNPSPWNVGAPGRHLPPG